MPMKIKIINLREVQNEKGNILKILNKNEKYFKQFGEAYLSKVNKGSIKAWKKHKKTHLNLIVISGIIKFVIYNDKKNFFENIILKDRNRKKIYIPAGLWFGFKGIGKNNIILSIASHAPNEKEILRKKTKEIKFNW